MIQDGEGQQDAQNGKRHQAQDRDQDLYSTLLGLLDWRREEAQEVGYVLQSAENSATSWRELAAGRPSGAQRVAWESE